MISQFLTLTFALFLVGCVALPPSPEFDGQMSDSRALQVMRADGASAGFRDVVVSRRSKTYEGAASATLDALLLREHFLRRGTLLPGMSHAGMSATLMLELMNDPESLSRHGMWLPVWMPHELAEHRLDAQLKMSGILEEAARDALPAGYTVEPYEWTDKAIFGAETSHRVLRVDGPGCEHRSCVIEGSLSSQSRPEISLRARMTEADGFSSEERKGGAYRYRRPGYISVSKITNEYTDVGRIAGNWHRIETAPLKEFDYASFYQRLSAALPNWAYIYVGPKYRHNEAGVPYVMHAGRQLLFVRQQVTDD